MMDNQPASPGPPKETLEPGTPVLPEERLQSQNLRALYAVMRWCTNTCQAEATSPPRHRPNPSKDTCQADSVKNSSKKHEDDIDHGYVHVDSAKNVDSVDMFQEIEVDDFVLINPNGNPVAENSPSTTTTTIEPPTAPAEAPNIAPNIAEIAVQEVPSPTSALSLPPNDRAPRLPPPNQQSSTLGSRDAKVSFSRAILDKNSSLHDSLPHRPSPGDPSLPTIAPPFAAAVSGVSNIGKRVSPPTELTSSPVESPCKCRKKYVAEAANWMAVQLQKPLKFRYQAQCRRESKLASFELDSSEYNDLEDCHRFDQPCCDPHITEVLENCLCNKLSLKQRRAYMIRACLQTQSLTGIHLPITNGLVADDWERYRRAMRDGTSPLPLLPGFYPPGVVPGFMVPHKCAERDAAKRVPGVQPQHTQKASPGCRTAQRSESLPTLQPPKAPSTVDPSHPSRLTRARQRVLSDLLEQHLDLEPRLRTTEQLPPKQAAQPVILAKPCDVKPPSKQNDPAVEKTSAREDPAGRPSARPESYKPRSKRPKTDIHKSAPGSKYDHPNSALPAGIRDVSYNEEVSALAAGRAWSNSVAAQDAAEVSIREALDEAAAQKRYRDSLRPINRTG